MSTELFEAKALADEIHDAAGVPEKYNPEIYTMTIDMITHAIICMDAQGKSMSEQRTLMGKKKDELIGQLKMHRENGVLKGEDGLLNRRSEPIKVHMSTVKKAS